MKRTYLKGSKSGNYMQVKINTDALEDLQSAVVARFITRVGIIGSKQDRSYKKVLTASGKKRMSALVMKPEDMTNAEIGLIHEKGSLTLGIPRRSFLEMPLVLKSEGLMAIRNKIWSAFIAGEETKARLRSAYVELGHMAERIVQAAFESRGFGHWQINEKTGRGTLIDTGQLRRSITSDVVAK